MSKPKNNKPVNPHKSTTHKEKYFHLDVVDSPRFSHATVFAREEVPGSGDWRFAVALCHKNDQFCRRTGRSVARRKYFNDDFPRLAPDSVLYNEYLGNVRNGEVPYTMAEAVADFVAEMI